MATAFQPSGFQLNAFQIAIEDLYAFQKCAFQFGAFQVAECDLFIYADGACAITSEAAAIFTSDAIANAVFAATGGTSISMVAIFEIYAPGVKRTLRIGADLVAISHQQDTVII